MSLKDLADFKDFKKAKSAKKAEIDLKKAEILNPIAWILSNRILNENGSPIEFRDHRFLIDPYLDYSPKQVAMKCLHPQTKILTASLRWVNLKDVFIGQRVFSVDEGSDRYFQRRLRIGVIEDKVVSEQKAIKIFLGDGREIIASPSHRFLCKSQL